MISSRKTLLVSALLGLVVFAPMLVQLYRPAAWPLDVVKHAIGRDFVNMWVGGRLLLEGNWPVLFDVQAYQDALHRLFDPRLEPHIWSYPPSNFLIAAPLALLPYGVALAVWTLAGLVVLCAVATLGFEPAKARVALLVVLLAPATLLNVICGQNGFFTAALFGGGVLLLDRRPVFAGVLIGLLSYKPQFGIVIAPVLLVLGAWRAIAAAAVTVVAMVLASVALFGVGPWWAFMERTVPFQTMLLHWFSDFFVTMLVSPYASFRHLGVPHGAAMGVQVVLTAFIVSLCALACRRTRDADTRLLLIAAASFLATPYALTYDLPVLALSIARMQIRQDTQAWSLPHATLYGLAWALPLASPSLTLLGVPIAPAVAAGVFVIAARDLLLDRKASPILAQSSAQ